MIMRPSFNTAGPCIPGEHYMLPPGERLGRVLELVEAGKYFTLHAGRQTGKTTSARWLVEHLNGGERFHAIGVELHAAREDPEPASAFGKVLDALDAAVRGALPEVGAPAARDRERWLKSPATCVEGYLRDLTARCPRPLVVLLDDADGMVGEARISFLAQIRAGFIARSLTPFPHSMALMGMRRVRDYGLSEEERRGFSFLGTSSPFNISAEDVPLGLFTREQVAALLEQNTAATGQRFETEAVDRIAELSGGHPWLVNALADSIVGREVLDRSVAITAGHVGAAEERFIVERQAFVAWLAATLEEARVRRVLDPMLAGGLAFGETLEDDVSYVLGLGLMRQRGGGIEIANPIYREVMPRALTLVQEAQIPNEPSGYVRADGSLDVPKLMMDWQAFWRGDGHLAAEGLAYRASGPHLMLMAFVQRIVSGGGRVVREYGLGRRALDLVVEWRDERYAIEVKLRRETETEEEAVGQLGGYLDRLGLAEGWLVVFDLRSALPWAERLRRKTVEMGGRRIQVVGC